MENKLYQELDRLNGRAVRLEGVLLLVLASLAKKAVRAPIDREGMELINTVVQALMIP